MSTVKFCVRCKIIANNSSVKSTDFIKWRESLDHVYRIVYGFSKLYDLLCWNIMQVPQIFQQNDFIIWHGCSNILLGHFPILQACAVK